MFFWGFSVYVQAVICPGSTDMFHPRLTQFRSGRVIGDKRPKIAGQDLCLLSTWCFNIQLNTLIIIQVTLKDRSGLFGLISQRGKEEPDLTLTLT